MKYLFVNWLFPVLIIGLGGWLSSDVQTSYDTRVFLGEKNEHFQTLKEFEEEFGQPTSTPGTIVNRESES